MILPLELFRSSGGSIPLHTKPKGVIHMYELLTLLLDEPRPYIIIEHPSRVVFTFKKRDKALAEATLARLNNPELILLEEAGDDLAESA